MGSRTTCDNLWLSHLAPGLSAKLLIQQLEISCLSAGLPKQLWLCAAGGQSPGCGRCREAWQMGGQVCVGRQKMANSGTGQAGMTIGLEALLIFRWWIRHWELNTGRVTQKCTNPAFHLSARTGTAVSLHGSAVSTPYTVSGETQIESQVKCRYPGNPVWKCLSLLSGESKRKEWYFHEGHELQTGWVSLNKLVLLFLSRQGELPPKTPSTQEKLPACVPRSRNHRAVGLLIYSCGSRPGWVFKCPVTSYGKAWHSHPSHPKA